MENYKQQLEHQLEELNALMKDLEKRIKKQSNIPDKHVRVTTSNGSFQFHITDRNAKTSKYATSSDYKLVKMLLQRDYDVEAYKKVVAMKSKMEKIIKLYDINSIEETYSKLSLGKQHLVIPIIETDEMYIAKWRTEHPGKQNSFPDEGNFMTNRGEFVRSKSEKIIADTLDKYGIPYEYEPLLILKGYHEIYPDFIALNVRTKKSYYWEHFGLLSDMEYAIKNYEKLQDYESSGYLLDRDLIISMESNKNPLKINLIEEKIKENLL